MSEYGRRTDISHEEPESGTNLRSDQGRQEPIEEIRRQPDDAEGIRDKAEQYGEVAREKAAEYGEKAMEQAEAGKDQAAEGMQRAADMLRERTAGNEGSAPAQAGAKVADGMESAAGYLRGHDMNEMWNDIETYARTHPAQALAGAVVTGFIIGRLIR